MKIKKKKSLYQIPILLLLILTIGFMYGKRHTERNSYYDIQVFAYKKMAELSEAVKEYKKELGIPIYDYDYFETGLLGDEYNEYTTSLGHLESKRTTTNPQMAALVVKMFKDIGFKEGDNIAIGFSGSFPALNLAVISAGEAMNLDYTIISSFGSSTYGANQGELTFPKMLSKLHEDRHTRYNSDLVTLGGDDDIAKEKPAEIINPIIEEYKNLGLNLMIEPNFSENINKKVKFYYEKGKVDGYVAVGGNVSFIGIGEIDISNRQGILTKGKLRSENYDENEGMIDYFLSQNVPTIHLLNVRKLVSDYGMPFDPIKWEEVGEGNIYYKIIYPKIFPILSLVLVGCSYFYLIKKGLI